MKNRLKKIIPFSVASLLLAGGGVFLADAPLSAKAEDATPAVGTVITTQTDFYGNQVELPVEFDGEKYILADYTRNIYVHDGTTVSYIDSIIQKPTNYPVYTSENGVFEDNMAISVYYNVLKAYDFYTKENIGEDYPGINGANDDIAGNVDDRTDEIPLRIFVHTNADGYRFNAAFTTNAMEGSPFAGEEEGFIIVGDGNPKSTYYNMYAQGAALDVIAHEYQHGVTDYISGLEYEGESGALNEAFSDIFGMLVEEHDISEEDFWLIGEDATLDHSGLRSTKDPQGDQGKTMKDLKVCRKYHYGGWHDETCDYDNVHYNSTIISHLQYTAWAELPEYFTRERIARLWYQTLTLVDSNETFYGFAQKWHQAAVELNFSEEAVNVLDYSLTVNGFKNYRVRKVTFQDEDGTILGCQYVQHGETATAPSSPYKEPTVEYEYVFGGWDRSLNNITEDTTITAVFQERARTYTVKFVNFDGTVLKEETVEYGKSATPPSLPVRESTEQFNYVFKRWEGDWQQVSDDVNVTAFYEEQVRTYTVNYFINGEERHEVLAYGAKLALPEPPEGYEGWYLDEACTIAATDTVITGDLTLYAKEAEDNIALILGIAAAATLLTAGVIATVVVVKKKKAKQDQ